MEPIIEIKGVGKRYNIVHQKGGYVALRDVITNVFKNPFRFAKRKAKEITGQQTTEDFWALKDINITIERGEVIGIIGANGAGKSTLLKVLSKITPPTTGEIKIRGRISSLLEVGTGFHPELTGRENIFLNGAILGMKRREITQKFDAIVKFAGVEKFLDTPVKYYSSGMYVRLAFSVAAHMEPDILIVDEVLAVGDADFQKKSLGKMNEVTKQEGRTILFVSHNMSAIKNLCAKTILLEHGKVAMFDKTEKVINYYLNNNRQTNAVTEFPDTKNEEVQISKISIVNQAGVPAARIPIDEDFSIKIDFKIISPVQGAAIALRFYHQGELILRSAQSDTLNHLSDLETGIYSVSVAIPKFLFNAGGYFFDAVIHRPFITDLDLKRNLYFEIQDINNPKNLIYRGPDSGVMASILDYRIQKLAENSSSATL